MSDHDVAVIYGGPPSANDNLDYIEESDDEEMFENISLDKYVDLNKKINMKCMYIHK